MTINWDQAINNKILIILLIFLLAIGALFVLNEKGIVDRWRDICSKESLNKLIL